jgi:Ca2+-binding RTX toxin-like protein
MWGGTGNDKFTTGDGNDALNGNGGNDTLNGGAGLDSLSGGDGNDRLSGGADGDVLDAGYTGLDRLDGGAGNDDVGVIARLDATANLKFIVTSTSGVTTLVGDGSTFTNIEAFNISGGSGNDTFRTAGGADHLFGYVGNDTLQGMGGNDYLSGGDGDDVLQGGAGDDYMNGGLGNDTMEGGAGADTYGFLSHFTSFATETAADSTGRWYDTIVGFDAAEDKIDLPSYVMGIDAKITGGRLSLATLAPDLENAITASDLGAHHAALYQAATGDLSSKLFLIIDANGDAGYQQGEDFVIALKDAVHLGSLATTTFI